ncbi:prepilin peptidase [Poseidonibacter ostreae]|uniref:Prepilin peptidase n=1 Tax=Poseidonibacter ostreae TaxID=2654171 RepID=A0A6L4WVT7_9BACT|nr:prepilin peptidase [Poseidonibacter ostreae]KAB7889110.1 prepilin peptidase [Poseidonibacter ostreae]KAB7891814.1 prepilin peptidase [Poseidonibacter ostreae]
MEVFSFIFGAVIGSFLNVLILRLPLNKSVVTPRSSCPSCNHIIAWYYNIPLFSFLFLRAKCAYCKTKISFQYFIVELLSASLTLALFIKLGLSSEFLYMSLLFYVCITLSFIDFKYKAVPDYLLLIVLVLSFFATSFSLLEAFKNAFLFSGAFVLLNFIITFYIQNIKARLLKDEDLKNQEALGEGDIPIIAMIAVILGIKGALVAIFLAAIFAIIPSIYSNLVKKDIQTPFIPYLILGMLSVYFFDLENILKVLF